MFHVKQVGLSCPESLRFTDAAARRGAGQPAGWLWKFDAPFRANCAGFCGKWARLQRLFAGFRRARRRVDKRQKATTAV
jgi:hypothetical protein